MNLLTSLDVYLPIIEVVLVGLALAVSSVVISMQPPRRARRALARAASKRLVDVVEGDRVHIKGLARSCGEVLRSPLTARRCLGYRFIVEQKADNGWTVALRGSHCVSFELASDGLAARVEGPFFFGLAFDDRNDDGENLPASVVDGLERAGLAPAGLVGRPRTFRYREAVLETGDPISVLGNVTTPIDPAGHRETPRAPPILRVIRGSSRAPVVLADEDEIGVLPLGELEALRR